MFVIEDYKLLADRGARRRRNPLRVLVAALVLLTTLGAVRFIDLDPAAPGPQLAPTATTVVSTPLSLPDTAPPPSSAAAITDIEPTPPTPPVLPLLKAAGERNQAAESVAAVEAPATKTPLVDPPTGESSLDSPPSLLAGTGPVAAPIDELRTPLIGTSPPQQPSATGSVPDPESRWVEHTVATGDSLARIFDGQGLEPALLHRIVHSSKAAKSLAKIRPGQTLRFQLDDTGDLEALEHHRSRTEQLRIAIADDGIRSEVVNKTVDRRTASAAGIIGSSLFVDGQKAGLSDAKIMELADIFGWDIDFALEIRAGDAFRLVYEEHYLDGEKLRDGPILAAEFSNRGQTFRAVRYENRDGEVGYYDDTGHSKRRAFLRTPIKFARISSRFNPKRWHPVLKKWRAHRGVDYAAPTGTPIKASGDGKVIFRGTKSGYGRTVILQHAGKYTTLYAHMSKYSKRAKRGARVKQGQVIGYVGKTGLATGPHLHYEFRVNGVHKDPLRVKLPKSLALPKKELPAFKAATAPLLAQLDDVSRDTMVASVVTDRAE